MNLHELAEKLGYPYGPSPTLQLAMIPKATDIAQNNDTLEFIGDSILKLAVTLELVKQNPTWNAGKLTSRRRLYVSHPGLVYVGTLLGLPALVQPPPGMPAPTDDMVEDAVEAIIGAIYTDLGLNAARDFILKLMRRIDAGGEITELAMARMNAKGALQEYVFRTFGGHTKPLYESEQRGTVHKPYFAVRVTLPDGMFATAEGSTRKEAEILAALVLVKQLNLEM